jgi:hypothetical protein
MARIHTYEFYKYVRVLKRKSSYAKHEFQIQREREKKKQIIKIKTQFLLYFRQIE